MEPHRELPIPAWLGLRCPKCDYALRGLPQHRCPECGLRFDIDDIISPATPLRPPEIKPDTRPLPQLGLVCSSCDEVLDGAPGDSCPHCGAAFDVNDYLPDGAWVRVYPPTPEESDLVAIALRNAGIPCIRYDEMTQLVVGLRFPGAGNDLRVPREYYLDALHVICTAAQNGGTPWRCPSCGEEVPGNFEICWHCQAPRSPTDPQGEGQPE